MMYRPEQNFPAQDNPEHRIPQFAGGIFDFHRLANLLRAKAWTDIPGLTDLLSGQIPLGRSEVNEPQKSCPASRWPPRS